MKKVAFLIVLGTILVAFNRVEKQESAERRPVESRLRRADFGEAWPLTVDEGDVECEYGALIFVTKDGKRYGLNRTALNRGVPRINPIWRQSPEVPGLRLAIDPLMDRARRQCRIAS